MANMARSLVAMQLKVVHWRALVGRNRHARSARIRVACGTGDDAGEAAQLQLSRVVPTQGSDFFFQQSSSAIARRPA
jgi:hypothetical protein